MEKLGTFTEAHQKVLADIQRTLAAVRHISSLPFATAEAGVGILDRLRKDTYEDLNQIQHEHLIVRAAEWLLSKGKCSDETLWYWNPRQTGDQSEPDLRGTHAGVIVISAEITTSENPVGSIDTRMQKTLAKLATMKGGRYYFVRTESMRQRATTKVNKGGREIEIIKLSL
jgi:hypothetical protein